MKLAKLLIDNLDKSALTKVERRRYVEAYRSIRQAHKDEEARMDPKIREMVEAVGNQRDE